MMKRVLAVWLCVLLTVPMAALGGFTAGAAEDTLSGSDYAAGIVAAAINPGTPNWRLAPKTLPSNETVVMGYSLGDFASPDTDEDMTSPVQTLLNALKQAGGGTLYIPAGRWVFRGTIQIPEGVTICGDWRAPTDAQPEVVGTVLCVYSGKGDSSKAAFITMLPNSEVRDVSFWYPEQDPASPVQFPYTIQMYKKGNWGADYTHIRNVTLVNSYNGIKQGPDGSGCPNIHNVYGTPLNTGIDVDAIYDIGRFDFIHFAPRYWVNSGLPDAPATEEAAKKLEDAIGRFSIGVIVGQVDWSYFCYSEIEGYAIGLYYVKSEATGGFSNGQSYGLTFRNCMTAIMLGGMSGAGELLSDITIENCDVGIYTDYVSTQTPGNLELNNVTINAHEYAVMHEGVHRLMFTNSTILGGEVMSTRGVLTMTNCSFATEAPQISLMAGCVGGIFQGNTAGSGTPEIYNQGKCPIEVDNTPVTIKKPAALEAAKAADKVVKPGLQALTVVTADKTGLTDATPAIQSALMSAGVAGGGTVFLPPGKYRLDGSLTVPDGVELLGAVDIGRIPFNIGTIFKVYGGQGEAEGTPTVTLKANAGLRGIVFDYPEQNHLDAVAYPYAVKGEGANIYIVNVAFRNGFNGVDLASVRCDNHYVRYIAGLTLNNLIRVGKGATGGVIANYQVNGGALLNGDESKYGTWPNSPKGANQAATDLYIARYAQENLIVAQVGDVSGEIFYNNFSYYGYRGWLFLEEDGKAASGHFVGNAVDYSTVGIEVRALGEMDIINFQVVSYINHAQEYGGISHHVYAHPDFKDTLNIFNMSSWGPTKIPFVKVESGTVNIYNSVYDVGAPAPSLTSAGADGHLTLQNGATHGPSTPKNVTNGTAENVSISGFVFEALPPDRTTVQWGKNILRLARWGVPAGVEFDPDATLLFTECFEEYATKTAGGIENALDTTGSFANLNDQSADANTTLYDDSQARLYMSSAATSGPYMRNSTLTLEGGKAGSLYQLDMRVCLNDMLDSSTSTLSLSVYAGTTMLGLADFCADGVLRDSEWAEVAEWEKETWYLISVKLDLRGDKRTCQLFLYGEDGELLAEGEVQELPEFAQKVNLSGLYIGLIADGAAPEGEAEALIDYIYALQFDNGYMLGDVDNSGKVDSTDARMVLQHEVHLIDLEDAALAAADVNHDNKVDSTDARLILQYEVGLITQFP